LFPVFPSTMIEHAKKCLPMVFAIYKLSRCNFGVCLNFKISKSQSHKLISAFNNTWRVQPLLIEGTVRQWIIGGLSVPKFGLASTLNPPWTLWCTGQKQPTNQPTPWSATLSTTTVKVRSACSILQARRGVTGTRYDCQLWEYLVDSRVARALSDSLLP
jgi:hypothetical protein